MPSTEPVLAAASPIGRVLPRTPAWVGRAVRFANRNLPGRRARWGNLRRTRPFSQCFGFDRGTPVDRVYIEDFLDRHRDDVAGRVLEVADDGYTRRYGGVAVTESIVVDVDRHNPKATLIADLCTPDALAEGKVDCVVLTQTLQLLPEPVVTLQNLWHALTPGGVLLLTVPAVSREDPASFDGDYWRWTPAGLDRLLDHALSPGAPRHVYGYGNALAVVAFTLGLAAEELRASELVVRDPSFVLVSAARVTKPA